MSIPGFSGDASLYRGFTAYQTGIQTSRRVATGAITAQQAAGCTILCDDWISCNNKCGAWPPGLSNYQCWLDCLRPTIDCLQGSTCFPLPPDCTTTGCRPPFICCDCVSPARCTSESYCRNVLCRL
jgi:hypothetical protein